MATKKNMMGAGLPSALLSTLKRALHLDSIGRTKVNVSSGALAGASLEVDRSCSCGSDVDCDIVLLSPTIAPRHFDIEVKNPLLNTVRLTATGGAITASGQRIEKGQWLETRMPVVVELAGNKLDLDQYLNTQRLFKRFGLIGLTLASLTGATTAGWTLGNVLLSKPPAVAAIEQQKTPPAPVVPTTAALGSVQLTAIKSKLQELNLLAQIETTSTPTGNIQFSGELGTEEVKRWREFLKWYDASKNPPMLSSVQRITRATALPRIAAISYGTKPRLFLTDGNEVQVGGTFGPGLVVTSITRDGLVVKRGQDTITLKAQ